MKIRSEDREKNQHFGTNEHSYSMTKGTFNLKRVVSGKCRFQSDIASSVSYC